METLMNTKHAFIAMRRAPGRSGMALATAAWMALAPPDAGAAEQRTQAAAQNPQLTVDGHALQRKDFRFGEFSGWLKRGGEWQIAGPARHHGLLCGTYEVGMRFGIGSPGCTDVQWVSGDAFATSRSQCNDAEMQHVGNGIDPALAERFDAISCAERVIRCSGNCK